MERIRAFVAIELPDSAKESLSALMQRLKPGKHPQVKWVAPDSVHLTLKFLGNIYSDQVPGVTEAIGSASWGLGPIEVKLGGLGAFPNLGQPRVIWVAVLGEIEKLRDLQRDIDEALSHFGFPKEKRVFTPHLTLGRMRDRASSGERGSIGRLLQNTNFKGGDVMDVKAISLMRSTLKPSGALYARLSSIELRGG